MLGSKFVRFLSILKQQVNSSSNFASFFIAMTHNSSVNFKLLLFILWIKEYHHSPNFVTFKCSGENLPYSSCNFPNHKSVFLQKKKNTLSPLFMDGVQQPQGLSYFKETVYLLPLSSQKFLLLILLTPER